MASTPKGKLKDPQKLCYESLRASEEGRNEISRYSIHGSYEGDAVRTSNCKGACHSSLNRYTKIEALSTSPSVAVWRNRNIIRRGERGSEFQGELPQFYEKTVQYWEWLVHESPWADIFLTKSLAEAEDGGVLIDVDTPANVAMLAIIATREPHEFPNRIEIWYDLVQSGADPYVSTLFMESIHKDGKTLEIAESGDIHDMFSFREMDKSSFKNFINVKYPGIRQPLRESGRFSGIHSVYRKQDSRTGPVVLVDMFSSIPMNGEGTRIVFNRGKTQEVKCKVIDYQEGIEFLASLTHNVRKEYSDG